MAQSQILYIATSKKKEIRQGAAVTKWEWGSYGKWTNFKSPKAASNTKVAYNAKTKNTPNTANGKVGGTGGKTVLGTWIPATVTRTISGVERSCAVRYHQRGYIQYQRPAKLKKKKKMQKITYTNAKPLQYLLQYQDKPILEAAYSQYVDGKEYVYFDTYYWDGATRKTTKGHLPHPTTCTMAYSDCRRNFESNTNNSDGRDNSGSYMLSNVRANIMTLTLEWTGLKESEGIDLLNTLNPEKNSKGNYPYLIVQYRDPQTGKYRNGTFFAEERSVEKYPNGYFKSIGVTLTEV